LDIKEIKEFIDAGITGTGGFIGAIVAIFMIMAFPVMRLARLWKSDVKQNARDDAEISLYDSLSKQVQILSSTVNNQREENNKLTEQVSQLKSKVMHFEDIHAQHDRLKKKLDVKDAEIERLLEVIKNSNVCLRNCERRATDLI
jgi:septal ring factor EnvC (AmiA/AmiB activator)